jgi:integrase
VLKGIRKTSAIPSVTKKPLTRDDIKSMLEVAAQPRALFALERAVAPTALCFQQMLRISEAVAIKGSDITFDSLKCAYIFKVRKAKNHSDGFSFTIPVDMGRTHCVGNYLRVYMAGIGLRAGDEHAYLVCKASRGTGGRWCANIKGGISIDTARAGLKDAVRAIRLDPKLYSTHSAKRRAATEAVKAGNTDAMVTLAGRWKSPSMASAYVRDNQDDHAGIISTFAT